MGFGVNTAESHTWSHFWPSLWSSEEVTKEIPVLIPHLQKRNPEMSKNFGRGWNVNQCFQSWDKVLFMIFNSLRLTSSAWAGAATVVGTILDHFLIIRCWSCLAKPHISNKCKEKNFPLLYFSPLRIFYKVLLVLKLFTYLEWTIVGRERNDNA